MKLTPKQRKMLDEYSTNLNRSVMVMRKKKGTFLQMHERINLKESILSVHIILSYTNTYLNKL